MLKLKRCFHFDIFIDNFGAHPWRKSSKIPVLLDRINLVVLLRKAALLPPTKNSWYCSSHVLHLLFLTFLKIEVSRQKVCIFLTKRKSYWCWCWHTDDDVFNLTIIDVLYTIFSPQRCHIKSGICLFELFCFLLLL